MRLQNHEIRGELDLSGGVLWRLVQVGDDLIALVGRINLEVDLPGKALIGTNRSKRAAAGYVAPRSDLHARYFCAR